MADAVSGTFVLAAPMAVVVVAVAAGREWKRMPWVQVLVAKAVHGTADPVKVSLVEEQRCGRVVNAPVRVEVALGATRLDSGYAVDPYSGADMVRRGTLAVQVEAVAIVLVRMPVLDQCSAAAHSTGEVDERTGGPDSLTMVVSRSSLSKGLLHHRAAYYVFAVLALRLCLC